MPTRSTRAEQLITLLKKGDQEMDHLAEVFGVKRETISSYVTQARRLLAGRGTIYTHLSSDGVVSWCWYSLREKKGQGELGLREE